MATTVTTKLQGAPPRRLRHIAIAVVASAALVASTGFVVNRIVDGSSTVAVQAVDTPAVSAAAVPSPADAMCGGEFGWVCAVEGISSSQAAAICGGEYGWVCAVESLMSGSGS